MQHEIEHIQPDRAALKWAVGCVSASYVQRLVSVNVVRITAVRWTIALFIASGAISGFFVAWYFYLKAAGWLGITLEGSDSPGFLPVFNKLPSWSLMLDGAASLLYIIAAYCLLRKKAEGLRVLVVGTAVNIVACTSQWLTVFQGHGPVASADDLKRTCVVYALRACVILLVWRDYSGNREVV